MDMELRRFAKVQLAIIPKHCLILKIASIVIYNCLLCVFKEMKMLDKEVRVWDVYTGLESMVKNLLTSLRAVNELQNSAVRERHWQQLMNTTGVWGRFGYYFTLFQNLSKSTRRHISHHM